MQALLLWALVRFWRRLSPRLIRECPHAFISELAGRSLTICLDTTEEWDV